MRKYSSIDPWMTPMWTVVMAAKHMNLSVKRVRALIAAGRLEAMRAGGRMLMVDRQSVIDFKKRAGGRPSLSQEQQRDFAMWLEYGTWESWMRHCPPSLMPGPCAWCGKRVGTAIPDGALGMGVRVTVKHYPANPIAMKLTTGKVVKARCPGSGKAPKGWRKVEEPVGRF